MSTGIQELNALNRIVHEPVRLMLMAVLYSIPETDFLYLQRELDLTQGNLSSHLAKLEEAGYVLIEKTFKGKYPMTICSLTLKGKKAFEDYARIIRMIPEAVSTSSRRT